MPLGPLKPSGSKKKLSALGELKVSPGRVANPLDEIRELEKKLAQDNEQKEKERVDKEA